MAKKHESVILGNISAVPLKPGDILVVHCAHHLSTEQKRILENDITKALWGKPNTFMVLSGDFKIAAVTPDTHA